MVNKAVKQYLHEIASRGGKRTAQRLSAQERSARARKGGLAKAAKAKGVRNGKA